MAFPVLTQLLKGRIFFLQTSLVSVLTSDVENDSLFIISCGSAAGQPHRPVHPPLFPAASCWFCQETCLVLCPLPERVAAFSFLFVLFAHICPGIVVCMASHHPFVPGWLQMLKAAPILYNSITASRSVSVLCSPPGAVFRVSLLHFALKTTVKN